MKICIVGAGNIGLVMAGVIAHSREHEVVVFTNRKFNASELVLEDVEQGVKYADLSIRVDDNPESALSGADYIFCTYPAFLRQDFILQYGRYIDAGAALGFVPGYGGAEYACKPLRDRGVIVFGLQRVPFVARQSEHVIARLLSKKKELYLSSIPSDSTEKICSVVEALLGIPTVPLKHYLAVTLAPSNPLLHLTGLYNVFNDWEEGQYFDRQLMFYEEWTDSASEMLLAYDEELQNVCKRIPVDLTEVVSLKQYYESQTPEAMTNKLKSIEAFKAVQVPLKKNGDLFYPDFDSRMFIEDFPYGIAIIKFFALLVDVETPTIDEILAFYSRKTGIEYYCPDGSFTDAIKKTGIPANYGLTSLESIVGYYA